ncbi:transcription elongation factor GreA [Halothiobacillus neapolitanus]|jgi:transcription elongation factor GreA|uniref:Transcription elongation factor GreA n=1 Tax=Halothiobacillus neapolitanus (strain ATCC 23641 / DSM 15147 / CIP 104769 / NCIMB 8539 / c2) TaxID=555778 RepID=D0L118_HALNC|nr:transcription elongation factor GreA [Halothiobacillus neapolitanus]ACX96391.1 transcription elongation factor GreA [Halothiobacillus neapolitanus c2]OZB73434.1 MAG: transcription elongation factor GreA [Halothiobacillus sp. 14-55-98]TDN66706.1 transcription elongation factor GreA [Halothiobacillus neapolitanus]
MQTPMTAAGAAKLEAELKQLRGVERPRIIQAIAEARDLGDLKENAEYHAAREEQGFVEGRIKEIEAKLSHANIIDVSRLPPSDKVIFGATVRVLDVDSDEEITYKIVGDDEADIKSNMISVHSPIARALVGKSLGDEVTVDAPGGKRVFEITEVQYIA